MCKFEYFKKDEEVHGRCCLLFVVLGRCGCCCVSSESIASFLILRRTLMIQYLPAGTGYKLKVLC